ncbi:hypothetical protein OSH11_10920 [Kaistia dalseonensis]|uniref:Uncharacterized protein n=1 Tax=Kaistia dalseonensis TaxID=410840 RepID=A0ABU0H685_9HYPH|nr:hypothetical protein [Kaistia dalseonensis]MCX5495219.1 hypothetical protein [Kaistia dalseonensis]MDQ0437805.1 hypothetical protein [Kaistia dalseonensis]
MNDASGRNGTPSNVRNLSDAIRKVRVAESERTDVVVELREAERVRLDMLADELRGVFAEVPEGDEQFVFQVSAGTQPRFWVDMTSFVMMARDRRTYRFLKDTRFGRTVILETANIDDMADCVTQYVAERIIERERALEGDWLARRIAQPEPAARSERGVPPLARAVAEPAPHTSIHPGWIVSAFLGGILVGAIVLLGYAWVHVG